MKNARVNAYAHMESPLGFRVWRNARVTRMLSPHTHADIELNLICRGTLGYRHGGVDVNLARGDLAVFWGGIPHQLLKAGGSDMILVTLPVLWFLRWEIPGDVAARIMAGAMLKMKTAQAPFVRWCADFRSGRPERLRALRLELEAAFQRMSPVAGDRRQSARAKGAGPGRGFRIEQVANYLALHYKDNLSLETIAAAVSVHSKYLARVFKRHCGLSVWDYLTRLRVAHAQRLLRATDQKIIDVALESGFGSVAPFYAAFSRYGDGRSPRKFRHQPGS